MPKRRISVLASTRWAMKSPLPMTAASLRTPICILGDDLPETRIVLGRAERHDEPALCAIG